MITSITMFCANCDGCSKGWEYEGLDVVSLPYEVVKDSLLDSSWKHNDEVPGTWYCPDCYSIDDNDVIIFKTNQL